MKYRYCGEYPLCFFLLSAMGGLWQARLWSGTWRVATLFDTPPLYRGGTGRKVETSGTHRHLSHTQDANIIQAGQALMVSCVSAHRVLSCNYPILPEFLLDCLASKLGMVILLREMCQPYMSERRCGVLSQSYRAVCV